MNEVEAAGNTPLHNCAYIGWVEGAELLLSLGAKVNASNNAGDRPWHWAKNMRHEEMMAFLEKVRLPSFLSFCWSRVFRRAMLTHPNSSFFFPLAALQSGASKDIGQVLVPDHVPKVKDFFEKECWAHHPKPHQSFVEQKKKQDEAFEKEANKLIPGM